MSFSMYDAGVPGILQTLGAMERIIDKAAAHCTARKIDPAVLVSFRLAPDMFPFARQIQIVTDQAKGSVARLAGLEIPAYADSETTFDELKARVAKTAAFVKSVSPAQIAGSEDKEITLKVGGNDRTFSGRQYLINFVLPNLYFHAATAYDILRHCGVELGKRDFLNA